MKSLVAIRRKLSSTAFPLELAPWHCIWQHSKFSEVRAINNTDAGKAVGVMIA